MGRWFRLAAAAVGFAAAPAAALAAPPPLVWTPAATAAVDAAAAEVMRTQRVRGLSVTVARDGVVLFAKGYGLADVAAGRPVTPATVFPIGSNTKTFTAAAIGLLIADGKLTLDARLADVLPDAPHGREITIRQLLNHTSGLREMTEEPGFLALATRDDVGLDELLALGARKPLLFTPGTRFQYSNTNYVLLGAVIARLSGMPYATFVQQRIATPLGLTTLHSGPPAGSDVARGYDGAFDTPARSWSAAVTGAAGGLYAAPADLVRFDAAFLAGRIVPETLVRALTTPPTLPAPETTTYAAGWVAARAADGHPVLLHNGGVPGANTRNQVFPDDGLAIVVFANKLVADEGPVVRAAYRTLRPPTAAQIAAADAAAALPAAREDAAVTALARRELEAWRRNQVDLSAYDDADRSFLTPDTTASIARALGALGTPMRLTYTGRTATNDETLSSYRIQGPGGSLTMTIGVEPNGKIRTIVFRPD